MDRYRNIAEMIAAEVEKKLKYERRYLGQVSDNEDPSTKGRVRVMVPDLGWDSQERAQWCWPRQGHGMSVPSVGQWVEVWFVAGKREWAAYQGIATEIEGQIPEAFTKRQIRVLLQDPDTGDAISYDSQSGKFQIRGDGDNLVTYSSLASALNTYHTGVNGHVHPVTTAPGTTGTPLPPITAPDISAAKAENLQTDG
jgi:hypothetical protein